MTREEAIEALTRLEISNFRSGKSYITEAFVMAINALRTEPCEDCISRQAVLDLFENHANGSFAYGIVWSKIKELPSVTAEKAANWVGIDQEPHEEWECNNCGFIIDGSCHVCPTEYRDIYVYCPNCGAKMEV